jgi:hypothetical protein
MIGLRTVHGFAQAPACRPVRARRRFNQSSLELLQMFRDRPENS